MLKLGYFIIYHNEVTYRNRESPDTDFWENVAFVVVTLFLMIGSLGCGMLSPLIGRRKLIIILNSALILLWPMVFYWIRETI